MRLSRLDGSREIFVSGSGWVKLPEGFNIVTYGCIHKDDYYLHIGLSEWVSPDIKIGDYGLSVSHYPLVIRRIASFNQVIIE